MEMLFSIDSSERGSVASALTSEFFTTKPFPYGPSSLPKCPPNKEFDAKVRDEESIRRQVAARNKGHRLDPKSMVIRESRKIPTPDAKAGLGILMQKNQSQPTSKSRIEKINPNQEEVSSSRKIPAPDAKAELAVEESKNSQDQTEIVTMGQAQVGLMRLNQTYGTAWDTGKPVSRPLQFDLWYQFWKKATWETILRAYRRTRGTVEIARSIGRAN
ncbi:hypothetical protein Nepgr_016379 [Nepenthes gracilis]|uniref:Uncharacterized protein n=1 Tax=Nepenthes gracilis TaxID=150966 RepID=A0AAD3SMK5_NEPGR|nr:hypothetical protein Nepgr_016379 [Nepenthes gracilis]